MAFFAKEEEKSQLLWLCSEPGQADYEEIIRNRITIVEFFEKYSSVDLPFEVFVEVCGIIKPRYFTIASSSNVDPRVINLCVSLVQEKVSPDRTFHGLCSNYLQNISLQDESIRCSLRKSSFKLPSQKEFPIIMIAAGAGIAPMRAFLQEGKFLKDNGYTLQQWVLFFGCRYRETDFIYENEIQNSLDVGVLSKLFFASSRDQPKKIYVQDLISENSQFLWDLIKLGAYIYVCG
jgi:NADPH-ferrihemoprotein reductase